MIRNLILASALAGTLLASTTASSFAQAASTPPQMTFAPTKSVNLVGHHGGGGGWHGGWHGGGHGGWHGGYRHRGYGGLWLGVPLVAGAYYASPYYGGCGWLYRRAVYTGSPYWWQRYHACVAW